VRKVSDQQASELAQQTAQIKMQGALLHQKELEIRNAKEAADAAAKRNAEAIAAATAAGAVANARATQAFQDSVF
jgi:hypothetical protein